MGEANRTSEARMRAAVQDVVTTLDRYGDALTRAEAICVLGVMLGTYALAWGGEEEVVGKVAEVAKTLVLQQRAKARATEEDDILFDLHRAIGDEPPSPTLVDEWVARHPNHAAAIRERAADIGDMQARMMVAEQAEGTV